MAPGALTKAGSFDDVPCTEEPIQRRLIAKDPYDQASGPPHHPTRDQNETVQKPPKLHTNVHVTIALEV